MIVSSNIGDVIQKVQACLGTMTQVKMRASKQVTTFGYQARTSGPVFEGDSIFVPGQRITFNHDFDQLREGHKSLSTAPLNGHQPLRKRSFHEESCDDMTPRTSDDIHAASEGEMKANEAFGRNEFCCAIHCA
ncbi:MAG: hypothetical protein LQ338_006645 [Usnochroma carphineum]|nr:MAG: hypothetical protein LQ338_006645 [Usnochroma carphineum]